MWASSIARSGLWSPCPSALDAILETTIPFIQPELSLFSTTSSTHPHTVLWSWGVCPLFVKPSFKKAFVPRRSSAFVWEGFHMVSKYNWKQKYRYSVGAAQDKWTLTICSAILEHPLADYFKFELSEASIYISTSKWRGLKMDASKQLQMASMDTIDGLVYFGRCCAPSHRSPVEHLYPPYGGLLGFIWSERQETLGFLVAS